MRRRTAWLWLMALEMVFYIVLAVLCSVTPRQFRTESGVRLENAPGSLQPLLTRLHVNAYCRQLCRMPAPGI
jgi:hypothetical protein